MKIFDRTMSLIEMSLDYSSAKNKVISNNIANVDTANFKTQDISFKNILNKETKKQFESKNTNEKHFDFSSSTALPYDIRTNKYTVYNHNGNNVDIDKEMSELSKNQIYYQSLIEQMNSKFRNIQTVVRGGR